MHNMQAQIGNLTRVIHRMEEESLRALKGTIKPAKLEDKLQFLMKNFTKELHKLKMTTSSPGMVIFRIHW